MVREKTRLENSTAAMLAVHALVRAGGSAITAAALESGSHINLLGI